MTDMDKRDFRIVAGKGFALDLPNGVTVSVQWGPGNYCDSDCRNADVFAPAAAAVKAALTSITSIWLAVMDRLVALMESAEVVRHSPSAATLEATE